MARKPRGESAPVSCGGAVRLSVPIDADSHKRLVTLALLTNSTIGEIVLEALAPRLAGVRLGSVGGPARSEEPADVVPAPPRLAL